MNQPFFSVLIPAKGRPSYLSDAISSVIHQDFQDVEVLVSNNGGDKALRDVVALFQGDKRIRYVEQAEILDMPTHWEKTSKELVGKYILILTDRSVLKAGALSFLCELIRQQEGRPEVISWPWDLYYDHLKILSRFPSEQSGVRVLDSEELLTETARGIEQYPYSLPRGLNSCIRKDHIEKMRAKYGHVFRPLNPDFSFGYLCLLNSKKLYYIERSLFVSQGLKVSNGGNSLSGDASPYFNSLGIQNPFQHLPFKWPLVQNGIHEDFLAMAALCGRYDLLKAWNRQSYYMDCFEEIDAKRTAGTLGMGRIHEMERELEQALMRESGDIQQDVIRTRTTRKKTRNLILGILKKALGARFEKVRKYRLLLGGKGIICQTALEAAGFDARMKTGGDEGG